MRVEQFVMAYGVEQDRVRALLTDGFISLRPALRINAEIRDEKTLYVELNAAAEHDGKRGGHSLQAGARSIYRPV